MTYENVKKRLVFILFSAFGSSWRAPSGVVFSFFRFPIVFTTVFSVSDHFFCFFDRMYVRFSVSDRFFFFFGFLGRCFLHERIHGRDSAPRGSVPSANQRESAAAWIKSEFMCYLKGKTRY